MFKTWQKSRFWPKRRPPWAPPRKIEPNAIFKVDFRATATHFVNIFVFLLFFLKFAPSVFCMSGSASILPNRAGAVAIFSSIKISKSVFWSASILNFPVCLVTRVPLRSCFYFVRPRPVSAGIWGGSSAIEKSFSPVSIWMEKYKRKNKHK